MVFADRSIMVAYTYDRKEECKGFLTQQLLYFKLARLFRIEDSFVAAIPF